MMLGGIATGLVVALLAGLVARLTPLREDASFAAFYLISLGLGVLLVSLRGSNMDLLHVLFGTVLGLDDASLLLVSITASVTLLALAALYRLLVAECLDPAFLRASGGRGGWVHMTFLVLVVVNLVAGFQVLGTLMVVGIMMLPLSLIHIFSWRSGSATCWRRQRLRRATATARLARFWPTMYLSSSETISPGVMLDADMRANP